MLFAIILALFVAFPDREDAIFAHTDPNLIEIDISGSLGIYYEGKCHQTYGNMTTFSDRKIDWCSNVAENGKKPYIQFSIKGKQMKLTRYTVRNGCCYYDGCCCTETGKILDGYYCCKIYSYSLIASNDKRTWTTLHKVEKDEEFYYCLSKAFDLPSEASMYKYVRFVLDEEYPNCKNCMQINQFELYGKTIDDNIDDNYDDSNDDDDESISIIGRVKKNE